MSTRNLGKVSPTFEGDYAPLRKYNYLEVVYFDGSSFVSLINDNEIEPIDDKVNWMMVARHGHDFSFNDFTPEQIALLQQPAIEAAERADLATSEAIAATNNANTATNNANTATTNANNAAQTANQAALTASDATERTIVATTNARNATQNAIDATNEAEQKIDDVEQRTQIAINNTISATNTQVQRVDSKITEANTAITATNTATENANNAADFANSQRGWSPQFVFEADGTQRIVKKLNAWIGGTGTAPTTNVGQYVTESGTYTANKANAANFKGAQADNLIYENVISGNVEVRPTSVDYTTNTFTANNHGLINGDKLILSVNASCDIGNHIPFSDNVPWGNGGNSTGYFVINATANTFQIGLTATTVMTLTNKGTDLTTWRFEKSTYTSINYDNLNAFNNYKIRISGSIARLPRYVNRINRVDVTTGYKNGSDLSNQNLGLDTAGVLRGVLDIDINLASNNNLTITKVLNGVRMAGDNKIAIIRETQEVYPTLSTDLSTITSISLSGYSMANGTKIQFFKY